MLYNDTVVEAVRNAVSHELGIALVLLTYLGSVYVLVPAIMLAYWRNSAQRGPWVGAIIGYYALISSLKGLNSTTRPSVDPPVGAESFPEVFLPVYEHAAHIATASFPSGHAMATTVVMGLFVLEGRIGTVRKRLLLGALVVSFVAFTRLALGVHYPIDVLAGAAFGIGYLAVLSLVRHRVQDETTAVFTLAAVLGLVAVSLPGPGDPLLAVGGAVGGLVAWRFINQVDDLIRRQRHATAFVGVGLPASVWVGYVAVSLDHPVVTLVASAIVIGIVVVLPRAAAGSSRLFD